MNSSTQAGTYCLKPFSAAQTPLRCHRVCNRVACSAQKRQHESSIISKVAAGLAAAAIGLAAQPSLAAFKLPPLDNDPDRCDRAYTGNTIGQANAVSDKLMDLRKCNYHGKTLSAKVLSGALVSGADFSDAILRETVMTKAYAVGANFEGADLTNAVVDRVDFSKANMKNTKFHNAIITGVQFKDADLSGASFDEALIGNEDAKRLCLNPTLKGESRVEVGCRN